ncbi:hypothetical protein [Streptomyces rhizosphaericus]|uniref:Uncharacterized protein n=1 Tax=Streptomyces rhizosphaericus TaxID=114699 RepID=A0A6G4AMC5_9ACTN|nr:hypothetical protein [Streptomyces rhizosphaericus]NEW73771.1 hypothetical protein [Streptomyces rhizosphaericus]
MPALSLTAMHTLALYGPFAARVRMAWTYVARQVLDEDPATPGNPLRVSLARSVLNPSDLTGATSGLTPVIATCETVLTAAAGAPSPEPAALCDAVTDDQLITAVKDAWNITAGVTPALVDPSAT